MAFAASSRQPERAFETQRSPFVCRIHACVRCNVQLTSGEPCSFVRSTLSVCSACDGQEQVNFQAPFEIRGRITASVIVTRNGQSSAAVDVPVLDVQPAVYATDGVNAVVVHNVDYTLVTPARPLVPAEFAFLYATGLGRAINEPATAPQLRPGPWPQSQMSV